MWITKRVEFSAAHRLYREDWTEAQNRAVFGECSNPFGHGHNYVLDVTIRGVPDPETGMIVHFSRLKSLLQELVVGPMDHRHLNHDVAFLTGVLPTSENVVRILWQRLSEATRGEPWKLDRLRLAASSRNWVEYAG